VWKPAGSFRKIAEVCNLLACTFLKQKSPQEAKSLASQGASASTPTMWMRWSTLEGACVTKEDLEGSRMHLQHAVDLAPQHSIAVQIYSRR